MVGDQPVHTTPLRVASTVHAVIVTAINVTMLATRATVWLCKHAKCNTIPALPQQAPSTITNLSLGFSLGYFVRDLAVSLWHYPKVGVLLEAY